MGRSPTAHVVLQAGGQTGVSISATIRVLMNKALDGDTVTATNCVLHKGSRTGTVVPASVVLELADPTYKTIKVAPDAALEYSTTYTLVLSGVKDTLGATLP